MYRAQIPVNYPFSHPVITCLNAEKSFHPNIQPTDGSICMGLLTSEGYYLYFYYDNGLYFTIKQMQ
jgi:ubiquitin-protein ligase